MRLRYTRVLVTVAVAALSPLLSPLVSAVPPVSDQAIPTTAPTLLQQLSDETQHLYRQSTHSLVRVQLPTPQWLAQYNDHEAFLQKWGPLMDPAVRQKIMEEQERATRGDSASNHRPQPSTRPATTQASSSQPSLPLGASATSRPNDEDPHFTSTFKPADQSLGLFVIGLLVDDQGHVVIPAYVDQKELGDSPLPTVTGDGESTIAKFIGSDAKTNLTVLQLANHGGTPAPLGHRKPEDGTLTLSINRDGSAKLVVWTSQHPEPGFAILPDGAIAGFGFDGHFLGAATAKPIVDQLIATGKVDRAFLGVLTQEVLHDDPLRRQHPELGTSPAIHIMAVQEGSAAAVGGICKDDLVLTIGGEVVGDPPTFAAVIATRRGNTSLRVLRGNKMINLTVNLQPK